MDYESYFSAAEVTLPVTTTPPPAPTTTAFVLNVVNATLGSRALDDLWEATTATPEADKDEVDTWIPVAGFHPDEYFGLIENIMRDYVSNPCPYNLLPGIESISSFSAGNYSAVWSPAGDPPSLAPHLGGGDNVQPGGMSGEAPPTAGTPG
jgi:hypothetical protein